MRASQFNLGPRLLAAGIAAGLGVWLIWSSLDDVTPARTSTELTRPKVVPSVALLADSPGWTNLFGSQFDSCSSETGLNLKWGNEGPAVLWRQDLGTGYSAPVVATSASGRHDLILLGRVANEEVLCCRDALTGEQRWQFGWPTKYKCPYEYSSGPYATPVIDGERIYAVGAQGQLHCVARETGELIWKRLLREEFQQPEGLFGYGAGILVDDQRLYLNVGAGEQNAGIVAFDKLTGETIWTATDRGWAYTTPRRMRIGHQELLLVLTDFGLAVLNADDGKLFGEYEFHPRGPDVINAVTPAIYGDHVLLVTGPGPGAVCLQLSLDPVRSEIHFKEVWQDRRVLDSQFNNLILRPDDKGQPFVYGFTASQQGGATFRCVDFLTGKLKWKHASKLGRGQSLAVDGGIILLGEHGHLAALCADASKLEAISQTDKPLLKSPCYSQPALHRGLLFVRNEREVVCIDLRTAH